MQYAAMIRKLYCIHIRIFNRLYVNIHYIYNFITFTSDTGMT